MAVIASEKSLLLPHTHEAGNAYLIGDIYDRLRAQTTQNAPFLRSYVAAPDSYYSYLQRLAEHWPNIRYLVDFMSVTCSPPKYHLLDASDSLERSSRTKVCQLTLSPGTAVQEKRIDRIEELQQVLTGFNGQPAPENPKSNLFIVEDLSREVIEAFGSGLDVDPRFFRGHICDYLWYNIRDPWIELAELEYLAQPRTFCNIRFTQPRYFKTTDSLMRARKELGLFNVLRRVDTEPDVMPGLEDKQSTVGMIRSKLSMWYRKDQECITAILLVDPPITEGFPLWGGLTYFGAPTKLGMRLPEPEASRPQAWTCSMFEQIIYWTKQLSDAELDAITAEPRVLAGRALMIVCSKWFGLAEYAKTRITQLEWALEVPENRVKWGLDLDAIVKRLHRWRRVLPGYQRMAADTFPDRRAANALGGAAREESMISPLIHDFDKVVDGLNDLQKRTERVIALATALVGIAESKKALQQSRDVARLTYLAFIFIPLQWATGIFSMQPDLGDLGRTVWIYFASAGSLSVILFAVVFLWRSPRFPRIGTA